MDEEWPIDQLFDEDYLHFFAGHHPDERTDEEASTVWTLLALGDGTEVLDLACGYGRIANRLAGMGARVTGLDATPLFWM
jgi:2-polyprenyl-3-methyl-5-hydroxy-6-metoxy-1,4-benzoquinol methylase